MLFLSADQGMTIPIVRPQIASRVTETMPATIDQMECHNRSAPGRRRGIKKTLMAVAGTPPVVGLA